MDMEKSGSTLTGEYSFAILTKDGGKILVDDAVVLPVATRKLDYIKLSTYKGVVDYMPLIR